MTSGNPGIAALKNGEPPTQGEIQAMANMSVPGRPKPPSLADAIRTIDGQPLVANEIIVSVDLEHKDPDVLAKRIALAFGGEITGAIPKARTYQVLVKADTAEVLDQISDDVAGVPGIEAAEAHWMVDKFGARTPNDSFFGKPLPDKPYVAQWDMAFLNLPQVWDITTGSPSVPVAVIDADFDPAHSDLKVNVRKAFGDRSAAGGHGTHVAATACGAGDNGGGIAGVAWQCNLRIYDFGASSALMAQEAMIEAIDDGARIVNISAQWVDNNQCGKMGSPAIKKRAEQMNATFAPAIKYAQKQKKDVLWVLAAGNECRDTVYASPASLVKQFPDNVIVVASVDPDGRLSHFSNFGDLVDVAAPGGEILSAVPRKCNPDCKDSFELQSGTSMAAPHVTGVAALMRSVNPGINAKKLKQCLLASASRPVGGQPFGIIDALSAVRCADG